jgi:hypothetical protein
MADGRLQCVGSSLFLKSAYGVGYTLTIIKKTLSEEKEDKPYSKVSNGDNHDIESLVKSNLPTAEPLSNVGAEISFRLPLNASKGFADLFDSFDSNSNRLGIAEYGISVTTLEEVFMRVGRMRNSDLEAIAASPHSPVKSISTGNKIEQNEINKEDPINKLKQDQDMTDFDENTALMFVQHFQALLIKRFIYGRRDQRMFICQLLLPVLIVILGLSLLLIQPSLTQPNYVLSSQQFNPTYHSQYRNFVPFYVAPSTTSSTSGIGEQIMNSFNNEEVQGMAVPIMNSGSETSVPSPTDTTGLFYGCSQGAAPLYNMSDYLLRNYDPSDEHGTTRYGAITVSNTSTETLLQYNMMINASAMHGVGKYKYNNNIVMSLSHF